MSPSDEHPELPLDPDRDPAAGARPLHVRPAAVGLVFVGGTVGTAARYGLAELAPTPAAGWPTGTFVANVVGAFVLGVLLEALARRGTDVGLRRRLRLLVGTGFCGGLTTYSTFAVESALLLRSDHAHRCVGLAVGYLAASLAAGLVAVTVGIAVAAAHHRTVRAAPGGAS